MRKRHGLGTPYAILQDFPLKVSSLNRLTSQNLQALLRFSEAILQTIRDPILVLDDSLTVMFANEAFFKCFKTTRNHTLRKSIYHLGSGQWNNIHFKKSLRNVITVGSHIDDFILTYDFEKIGKRVMNITARRIQLDNKATRFVLVVIRDITEEYAMEERKSEFISIASHELKSPITTVKAYIQMLEKRMSTGEKQNLYFLKNISSQIDNMTALVNYFLDVGRIDSGRVDFSKKEFDLEQLIQKALVDFQFTTETHAIIKKGHLKKSVLGDESRILEVFTNLLTNAIKYSPHETTITIRLRSKRDSALVSVTDEGVGIPKPELDRVFDRFFRVKEKVEKKTLGSGLGLYIASQIIRLHGGTMWVDSEEGKGSTFYFTLPYV